MQKHSEFIYNQPYKYFSKLESGHSNMWNTEKNQTGIRHVQLSRAAQEGNEEDVRRILREFPQMNLNAPAQLPDDPVGLCSRKGLRALHRAVLAGSPPCVRLLLAAGAEPDVRTLEGVTARQLVGSVLIMGHRHDPQIVKELRAVFNKHALCKLTYDRTQSAIRLCRAVEDYDVGRIETLLGMSADPNIPVILEDDDQTYDVYDYDSDVLNLFQSGKGLSAGHRAAFQGNDAIMKLLLKAGCDPNTTDGETSNTPLHLWMLGLALGWGAGSKRHHEDGVLANPAHRGGIQCGRMLIKAGAKLDARNSSGYCPYPLHCSPRYPSRGSLTEIVILCMFYDERGRCDYLIKLFDELNLTELLGAIVERGLEADLPYFRRAAELLVLRGADPEILRAVRVLGISSGRDAGLEKGFVYVMAQRVGPCKKCDMGLIFEHPDGRELSNMDFLPYQVWRKATIEYDRGAHISDELGVIVARVRQNQWSRLCHFKHPRQERDAAHCIMLCAERLRWHFQLHLPAEVWEIIVSLTIASAEERVSWPIQSLF